MFNAEKLCDCVGDRCTAFLLPREESTRVTEAAGLPACESSYSRRLPKVAVLAHLSGLYSAGFVVAYGGGTASELHRLPWTASAFGNLLPQPTWLVKSGMGARDRFSSVVIGAIHGHPKVGVERSPFAIQYADYDVGSCKPMWICLLISNSFVQSEGLRCSRTHSPA